jgi:hypothetical protein
MRFRSGPGTGRSGSVPVTSVARPAFLRVLQAGFQQRLDGRDADPVLLDHAALALEEAP